MVKRKHFGFSRGDVVHVMSNDSQPFVASIMAFKKEKVKLQWMYKPTDLPRHHHFTTKFEANEIFLSTDSDWNDFPETVIELVSVIFQSKSHAQMQSRSAQDSPQYFCRYEYNARTDRLLFLSDHHFRRMSCGMQQVIRPSSSALVEVSPSSSSSTLKPFLCSSPLLIPGYPGAVEPMCLSPEVPLGEDDVEPFPLSPKRQRTTTLLSPVFSDIVFVENYRSSEDDFSNDMDFLENSFNGGGVRIGPKYQVSSLPVCCNRVRPVLVEQDSYSFPRTTATKQCNFNINVGNVVAVKLRNNARVLHLRVVRMKDKDSFEGFPFADFSPRRGKDFPISFFSRSLLDDEKEQRLYQSLHRPFSTSLLRSPLLCFQVPTLTKTLQSLTEADFVAFQSELLKLHFGSRVSRSFVELLNINSHLALLPCIKCTLVKPRLVSCFNYFSANCRFALCSSCFSIAEMGVIVPKEDEWVNLNLMEFEDAARHHWMCHSCST